MFMKWNNLSPFSHTLQYYYVAWNDFRLFYPAQFSSLQRRFTTTHVHIYRGKPFLQPSNRIIQLLTPPPQQRIPPKQSTVSLKAPSRQDFLWVKKVIISFGRMSETYGISTYGKEYLVDEGLKELPPLRIIFITINVLLSIGPLAYLASRYWSLRKGLKAISRRRQAANALQLLTSSFVAFMVNNTLRSLHMVDHICRPVYYHEPRWAYEKIWITEMEVPTYANFLMAIIALQGLGQLFRVVAQGDRSGLPVALSVMGLYVVGSLFNLVHYTIEPPSNYGPFANFNIAGTAITNLPIVYFLVKAYLYIPEGKGDQLLSSEAVEGSGTRASSRKRAPVNRLSY